MYCVLHAETEGTGEQPALDIAGCPLLYYKFFKYLRSCKRLPKKDGRVSSGEECCKNHCVSPSSSMAAD